MLKDPSVNWCWKDRVGWAWSVIHEAVSITFSSMNHNLVLISKAMLCKNYADVTFFAHSLVKLRGVDVSAIYIQEKIRRVCRKELHSLVWQNKRLSSSCKCQAPPQYERAPPMGIDQPLYLPLTCHQCHKDCLLFHFPLAALFIKAPHPK